MRREAECARDLVREAGEIVAGLQGRVAARQKPGGDGPVTEADLASEEIVLNGLERAFPGDRFVSEETRNAPPPHGGRIWCVDPLDGTREFVQGLPEYAVMAGLLVDGEPVAGAFALPAEGVVFWGWREGGAFVDGDPIALDPVGDPTAATAIHSRSHKNRHVAEALERIGPAKRIPAGGVGYKVGQILLGRAHLYVHPRGRTRWWDSVAPAAVLMAAGGAAARATGEPFDYEGGIVHEEGLLFTAPGLFDEVVKRLRRS